MKVVCKLFGFPDIYEDDKRIQFPYSKVDALLYYLMVEKKASRTELSAMLWPEDDERTAKKNLRNAIYQCKRNMKSELILTPNNTVLQLNEDVDLNLDVDEFINDPIENINLCNGEFLQGFEVNRAYGFDDWVSISRNNFHKIYLNAFYEIISSKMKKGDLVNIEPQIQRLIEFDRYDEKSYRLLMDYYAITGRNSRVIETYSKLKDILKTEIKAEPSNETRYIYREALNNIDKSERQENDFFFGRKREVSRINALLTDFLNGEPKAIFLEGEVGTGKTKLCNEVFSDYPNEFKFLNVECFKFEEKNVLRSVEKMARTMYRDSSYREEKIFSAVFGTINKIRLKGDVAFDSLEITELSDNIVKLLDAFSKKSKLIVVIKDFHWIDNLSNIVFTNAILNSEKNIMYLITSRGYGNSYEDDFLVTLENADKLEKVFLGNFTKEETREFLKKLLEKYTENVADDIYERSDGNPLFIKEYAKLANSRKPFDKETVIMENTLRANFAYLNDMEVESLEILSFFKDKMAIGVIYNILDLSEEDTYLFLDKMVRWSILSEEEIDGEIYFSFKKKRLKNFLYSRQSKSKKKYFHGKIADTLAENFENKDIDLLEEIAVHYENAENTFGKLKYEIEILNYYLNFSHELFPVVDISGSDIKQKPYISGSDIRKHFYIIEEDFKKVREDGDIAGLNELELEYDYIIGRYYIREGNYDIGLESIKNVIKNGTSLNKLDFVFNGYKQMIFYNIQRNNAGEMIYYIEKALNLAVNCNLHNEIAMLQRLKGLYLLMTGEYEESENMLRKSIDSFSITEDVREKFSTNIAAAHNYISEIYFANGKYDEAIAELYEAIDLTKDSKAYSSMSIFYINVGKVYFAKDEIVKSKRYFNFARELYGKFETFWKRPVLEAYLALIYFIDGEYDSSAEHLKTAIEYEKKMHDPRGLGAIYFAEFLISGGIEDDENLYNFKDLIKKDREFYRTEALKKLDKYRDVYEIEILKRKN